LRAEQLDTLPKYLAEKIQFDGVGSHQFEQLRALEGVAS